MTTQIKDFLVFSSISDETQAILTASLIIADSICEELINLNAVQLAKKLIAAGLFSEDNKKAANVAIEILSELNKLGIKPNQETSVQQPVVSQQPMVVTLNQPKKLEEKTVLELLEDLSNDPTNIEFKQELLGRSLVKKAKSKTGDKFAFKTKEGMLDAKKTLDYLNHLADKPEVRKFQESFPKNIDEALGSKQKVEHHCLIDGLQTCDGWDYENDLDWNKVPLLNRQAAYYALKTGSTFFPKNIDVFVEFEALSQSVLNLRWAKVLEDYQQYLEGNDPINLAYKESLVSSISSSYRTSQSSVPIDYLELVRDQASPDTTFSGANTKVRSCIYESVKISGSGISLNKVIVLDLLYVSGVNTSGTVYCLTHTVVKDTGFNNDIIVRRVTPDVLYNKAKELELF
jgi:hypothetical protein